MVVVVVVVVVAVVVVVVVVVIVLTEEYNDVECGFWKRKVTWSRCVPRARI